MQAGDVPATHADTSRLQEWVGYKPATPLETGLSYYREWYCGWRA
jgi:UDP-glucuronate 4-epimerase